MKITLIVLLYVYASAAPVSTTATGSGSIVCSTNSCTPAVVSLGPTSKKILIPMPDLKSCLEARHQFDNYQNTLVAACSAE